MEETWIQSFCLDQLGHKPTAVTPMHEIYAQYHRWLAARKLGPSVLSLDGFGRMFPKTYPRRIVPTSSGVKRGVVGVELR